MHTGLGAEQPRSPLQLLQYKSTAAPQFLCRRLLETRPPGGGFQAAKYFTYIFFALAIALITMMVVLCGLYCTRRMRLRRALAEAPAAPTLHLTVPLPSSQSIRRHEQPIEMAPIKVFCAVTVYQPDGGRAIAWSNDQPVDIIQPERSAAQKATSAAREMRRAIGNSSSHLRHEERRSSGRRHRRRRSDRQSASSASLDVSSLRVADAVSRHLPAPSEAQQQLQRGGVA